MFEELGISGGTAIICLIALYFIIKWGVKNGMREAIATGNKEVQVEMISQVLEECVGKKCKLTLNFNSQTIYQAGFCISGHVLAVDETWVQIGCREGNQKEVVKLIRIHEIHEVEVLDESV
ncbi:MAG: DUF6019 family protein [Turicibacter sp.]